MRRLDRATVRRTLAAARSRLLALPNVEFLAVGPKRTGGARLVRLAIRVFVRAKRDVPRGARVPRRVRAVGAGGRPLPRFVPTDVERTGGRYRGLTAAGAALVGRRRGSLGLAYRSAGGRRLILTCSHVVAPVNRKAFGEPVRVRTGEGTRTVGRVHRMHMLDPEDDNHFDAALLAASMPVGELVIGEAEPVRVSGAAGLGVQDACFYLSQDARVACEGPELLGSSVEVDLGRNVTVRFSRCFRLTITRGDPLDGHSGSVLLARRGAAVVACGLVFAGNRGSILATSLPETLRALSRRRASADGSEEDVSIAFGRWPGPPRAATGS